MRSTVRLLGTGLLGLVSLIDLTLAQANQDQINNFCRRFSHQTTWIDGKLYVDGGYIDYGGSIQENTPNYTNPELLWADTTAVNDLNFPQMYTNLSKPANVPSVAGGALWADQVNKLFYLFGGEYNSSTPPPQTFTLWFFDTIYNTWNTTSSTAGQDSISPLSFGSSAVDQNKGMAYYYGGWKSNATEVGFNGNPQMQSGLITYDLSSRNWRTTTFIDDQPRAEGGLYYMPISDQGMLVYFGGVTQPSNGTTGNATGVGLDTIYLYDIGSQQTYTQRTSGAAPDMRRRFCGGVSWPNDRSSYNIYIYGGAVPYDQEGYGYGDLWILSIPSFTWTLLYNDTTGSSSHHSLSCDIINEGQMMIMGGWFPNSTNTACDAPSVWGMHNLNLGANDALDTPWYQFLPNLTEYTLPPNLTAVVGGSATGPATLTAPSGGFDSQELGTYMGRTAVAQVGGRTATRAIPSATSSSSSNSGGGGGTDVGAIVGGVIGGVAGVVIILAIVWFCLRRRKRSKQVAQPKEAETHEAPDTSQIAEAPATSSPTGYGASPHSKRHISGGSWASSFGFSQGSETSPRPGQTNWQPVPVGQPNAQQYYPPPPQSQQYYPPPPAPQQHVAEQPSPAVEMPSVRSPTNVQDVRPFARSSPSMQKNPDTINEE